VDVVTKETGYIDLLVNNAGQTTFDSSPNARPKPTPQSSVSEIRDYYFNYRPQELWRDTLETNIAAVFTTSMAFLELLDAGNKRRAKELPKSQIIVSLPAICSWRERLNQDRSLAVRAALLVSRIRSSTMLQRYVPKATADVSELSGD
jgi:NAD(P)-dependent dehydrogenase (short-subunit alcohol dehydrogenase family)